MVRRLARRQRKAPPESIPLERPRRDLPAQTESEADNPKPSNTASAIAAALSAAAPPPSHMRQVGRELATELAGVRGRIPAAAITGIVARWKKDYAPRTIHNHCICLKQLLRAIDAQLGTGLAQFVPKTRRPDSRRTTIEPDELQRMIDLAPPALRLFVLLMSVMGLRFAEAQSASPADFNREKQTLTLTTKGGHRREFPVPDQIAELFSVAPDAPDDWTYIERLRGARIHKHHLRRLWNRLKKKAGVRDEVHPHDLRRTAALRVYTLTKDVLAAKELLGHDNLNSTAYYLQPYDVNAMKAIRHAITGWTPRKGEPVQ